MRTAVTDIAGDGGIWRPQFYTEIEEDLCVEFRCQGLIGYGSTAWCFPVREVLDLIVDALRQEGNPRMEWLYCLAESFYGPLEASEVHPTPESMKESQLRAYLEDLVFERDATHKSIMAGKLLTDEWGTSLDETPPTTIDFVFPCRKLVKSDEDLWTFPARWVLKLIEADMLRRNDPEAKHFRDLVAYFYPEIQPAFWSTIGAIPS